MYMRNECLCFTSIDIAKNYTGFSSDFVTNNTIQFLAYQQNTMYLAIYNTKQYDIHLLVCFTKPRAPAAADTNVTTPPVTGPP